MFRGRVETERERLCFGRLRSAVMSEVVLSARRVRPAVAMVLACGRTDIQGERAEFGVWEGWSEVAESAGCRTLLVSTWMLGAVVCVCVAAVAVIRCAGREEMCCDLALGESSR